MLCKNENAAESLNMEMLRDTLPATPCGRSPGSWNAAAGRPTSGGSPSLPQTGLYAASRAGMLTRIRLLGRFLEKARSAHLDY